MVWRTSIYTKRCVWLWSSDFLLSRCLTRDPVTWSPLFFMAEERPWISQSMLLNKSSNGRFINGNSFSPAIPIAFSIFRSAKVIEIYRPYK